MPPAHVRKLTVAVNRRLSIAPAFTGAHERRFCWHSFGWREHLFESWADSVDIILGNPSVTGRLPAQLGLLLSHVLRVLSFTNFELSPIYSLL